MQTDRLSGSAFQKVKRKADSVLESTASLGGKMQEVVHWLMLVSLVAVEFLGTRFVCKGFG